MSDHWGEEAAAAQRGGRSGFTRATGEMPSVLGQPEERAEFFRYEARLNEVIPDYPQVILCLYDLERYGSEVLMDTLRTHPRVIVDGMIYDNPYYIEPGKFLARSAVVLVVPHRSSGGDGPLREQLSALRSLLVLSMLLTRQDDQAGILHLVARAVESLGPYSTERMFFGGRWTEIRVPEHQPSGPDLEESIPVREGGTLRAGRRAMVVGLPDLEPARDVRLPRGGG